MIDTAPNVTTDRGPAHYPEQVDPTDDELTPAREAARDEVRAAAQDVIDARRALAATLAAREITVHRHGKVLRGWGLRPAARAIGNINETTLRGDLKAGRAHDTDDEGN